MNRILFAARNFADKLDRMLRDPNLVGFYVNTYILSRFENIEPDCYIVSYPKCGRAWLRMMLKTYAQSETDSSSSLSDGSLKILGDVVVRFSQDRGRTYSNPWTLMRPQRVYKLSTKHPDLRKRKDRRSIRLFASHGYRRDCAVPVQMQP